MDVDGDCYSACSYAYWVAASRTSAELGSVPGTPRRNVGGGVVPRLVLPPPLPHQLRWRQITAEITPASNT